jgi:hypothetical protein
MVSIGSGGALGKGLGKGPHNRLDYLPERHNDRSAARRCSPRSPRSPPC